MHFDLRSVRAVYEYPGEPRSTRSSLERGRAMKRCEMIRYAVVLLGVLGAGVVQADTRHVPEDTLADMADLPR